jgi:GTP-binding protein LepA
MKIFSLLNKPLFYHCGRGVVIGPSCEINHHQYISLGDNVCIGRESWIDCPVENLAQKKAKPIIIIEDGVDIGRRAVISGLSKIHLHKNILLSPNVYISDHSHQYQKTDLAVRLQGVAKIKPVEIGIFVPDLRPVQSLVAGEVGYIATGLKTVRECRVGDTITSAVTPAPMPLPGYRKAKPMVFAGIYPVENEDYENLKEALEKLQLNDASLSYEPETSQALKFGFRCGFLGMFHMEIIQERLEREYDLDIIVTAPSVEYEVLLHTGEVIRINSPTDLPNESEIAEIREPWMKVEIYTPTEFYGAVMEITTKRRGTFIGQDYPAPNRVQLIFEIPLSEMIVDYFDQLKSHTRGYASMDYQFLEYRSDILVKLEILVNNEPLDALAMIVHKNDAYHKGQALVSKLKDLIPRQLFIVPIQASAEGRIISRATAKAIRKDVLAKCYGGDISRKKKLLEKQKRGKKRMKMVGNVEIPQEAFLAILRIGEE